ncbi:MAG: hypothetical protein ACRCZ9_08680 [Fusobacteriaceae bacterium]
MRNDNNIINQMVNDDKQENRTSFMASINKVYDTYLGSLNNETESFKNNEDERAGGVIEYIYPSEIGLSLGETGMLYFGTCKRSLFLKLAGAFRDNQKDFDEIATIERINLIKKQWIEKFKVCGNFKKHEDSLVEFKALGEIKISNHCDGVVYDYELDTEMMLLIKPIEHNFITKDSVFSENGTPMYDHLSEAIAVAMANRKQVKILYVGKNKAKEYKEYNIGSKAGVITINGVERVDINITNVLSQFSKIKTMLESNMVPPRDYGKPGFINQQQLEELKKYNVIREQESWKYLNNKEMYTPFRCSYCNYQKTCNAMPEDWCDWKI